MVLNNSEVSLVFLVSNQKAMECYRRIAKHLVEEGCHDFSVSQDHEDGHDMIILNIKFSWSETLSGIAKIILDYEEGF